MDRRIRRLSAHPGRAYGSIDPKSGKSYTRLEYEYALDKGKQAFACVLKDAALDARVKKGGMEMIDKNQKELDEFRALVKKKVVEFWEDSKDIQNIILKKLGQLARREDLVGWVRPNTQVNVPAITDEMARLSKENARLLHENTLLLSQAEGSQRDVVIAGLRYSELKAVLQNNKLWSFLVQESANLRGGSVDESPEAQHLNQMGLLRYRQPWGYELTEAGRMLMNRIDLELLQVSAAKS